jgi:hypothetical protein
MDSNTLEVGLLKDVGFSPPPDKAEHFGHSIRFVYRAMSREDLGPVQCFDQPEDFRNWRELYRRRAAGQAGWMTYGSEQTCLLAGNFVSSATSADSIPMHFTRTSTARLPDGTTELVLSVTSQQALPQVPRIILPPKTQLLVLQRGGAIHRYRLVGAEAERVLDQLARAGEVRFSSMDEQGVPRSVDVAHEDFAAAYAAFKKCLGTLGAP